MKTAILGAALLLLTGCSVVPPEAWAFDPNRPLPKAGLPLQELVALTDRVAELQLQRNATRASIAGEADARRRELLYAQLHAVGMELSPLERRLATMTAAR